MFHFSSSSVPRSTRSCGLDDEGDRVPAPVPVHAAHAAAPLEVKEVMRRAPRHTGVLVLADGRVFRGQGIGAEGRVTGELCFNTAMTGYQEMLERIGEMTDRSASSARYRYGHRSVRDRAEDRCHAGATPDAGGGGLAARCFDPR